MAFSYNLMLDHLGNIDTIWSNPSAFLLSKYLLGKKSSPKRSFSGSCYVCVCPLIFLAHKIQVLLALLLLSSLCGNSFSYSIIQNIGVFCCGCVCLQTFCYHFCIDDSQIFILSRVSEF